MEAGSRIFADRMFDQHLGHRTSLTGLSIDRVRLSPSSADSSGQMLRCRPSEETMEVVDRSSLS